MTRDKLEDFLVDLCFADWEDLPAGLKKIGLRTSFLEKNFTTIVIHGAFPCGFSNAEDPQGRAIQISMAVAGAQAALHFPDLLLKVNQRRGKVKSQKSEVKS